MMRSGMRTVAAVLLVALTGLAFGDAPLTTADLLRFLKVGISERTIVAELQTRGFAEPLDQTRENALREAGATETLIVAVRRVAKSDGSAPPSTPPAPPAAAGSGAAAAAASAQ